MKSIYLKNSLLLAGMVLLSFLLFLLAAAVIIRNYTIADTRASLESNATAVEDMFLSLDNFNPNQAGDLILINYLVTISTLPANHVLVANTDGVIVACSERKLFCEHLGYSLPPALLQVLRRGDTLTGMLTESQIEGLLEGDNHAFAKRLYSPIYGHGGYVFATSAADMVVQEWQALLSMFLFVAAAVLLMAVVLAMLVARHQVAPLKEISDAAHQFARGDYSARVMDTGRIDEIEELSTAFNAMADAIEQSENMRREFVGNISHELKTPMTSITGFAEGILDGTIPPDKQGDYIAIILSEARRLSRLVRRMLEISRLQFMEFEEMQKHSFDVTERLRRGVLGLEGKITEKDLDVEMNLPDHPVMVAGDEDLIMQVIYNLLDNAAKFSHPGNVIGVSLVQKSNKVFITVKNTGDAIAREELPYIFNRFHKSDKSRSYDKDGVGLGLYIVKTIMNAHREDIYVRSDSGITEFLFTLTVAPRKKVTKSEK